MYEIINKKGSMVVFKDDKVKSVLVTKDGLFSSALIVVTNDTTITITKLDKKEARVHYNVLHDMIVDQEGYGG